MPRKDYSYAYSCTQRLLSELKAQLGKILPQYSLTSQCEKISSFVLEDKENVKDQWEQLSSLNKLIREVSPEFKKVCDVIDGKSSSPSPDETNVLLGNLVLSRLAQDTHLKLSGCSFDTLVTAIREKNEELIRKVVSEVPMVKRLSDDDGWDPIHYCAAYGNKRIMDIFIDEYKCKVDSRTEYSYTPLHIALKSGNKESLISLLEHGASLDLSDRGGKSWIDFLEIGFPKTESVIARFAETEEPVLEYKGGHFEIAGDSAKYCIDAYL